MNKQETAQLLAVIKTAFPNFEITEPVARLWVEFLDNVPFERAQMNLKQHIKTSKFPPTIADIVRAEPESTTHGEALLLEGERRLEEFEQWKQKAVPPPEHLLRRNKVKPID